jgi:inhibitor of cysteine peptidase
MPSPEDVTVDESYSGEEVEIAVDGTLTLRLTSNPSTGFSWSLVENSNQTVLKEMGHKYISANSTNPPIEGASGKEEWVFEGSKTGRSSITMKYGQPWEEGQLGAEQFILDVVVG